MLDAGAADRRRDISDVLCVGGSTRIPTVRQRLADTFRQRAEHRDQPRRGRRAGRRDPGRLAVGLDHRGHRHGHARCGDDRGALAAALRRRRAAARVRSRGPCCSTSIRRRCRSRPPAATPSACSTRTRRSRSSARACSRPRATTRRASRSIAAAASRAATPRTSRSVTLLLEGLPPKPRGDLKIEVCFRVDADGILHVRAARRRLGRAQEARMQVIGAPTEEGV